jgi:hypothetical protein
MVSWLGFRQASIPYERRPRRAGDSKMSRSLLFGYLTNGIFGFSFAPARAFAVLAAILATMATVGALVCAGLVAAGVGVAGAVWIALLIMGAAALNALGFWTIGEYAARSYFETIRRPIYIVRETVNVDRRRVERLQAVDQYAVEPRRR